MIDAARRASHASDRASKLAVDPDAGRSFREVPTPERQYQRFAHDTTVRFLAGKQVTVGRTLNLSRGGLCAHVTDALPIGADVQVDIALVFEDKSQSEPLNVSARVVWCTALEGEFQVGVSFRPLDAQRANHLSLFLDYLSEGKPTKEPRAKTLDERFRGSGR